ncbi:MAG: hypothetical protein ACK50A_01795 [Sphingobacteriaceae bacterium]
MMIKQKYYRYFAFFMVINLLFEVISPTMAMALTSGPQQPEFTNFEPAGSSEMVDLFTGDFKYNIPLMDVDGYPLNLSYHAGQNMESEASWVGLGWSMNPGVINRMVKGLPDDFNGEIVKSKTHIKPQISMGAGFQYAAWLGGNVSFDNAGVGAKVGANGAVVLSYNNYKGFGLETERDAHLTVSRSANALGFGANESTTKGVGTSVSSQDGGSLSENYSTGVGVSYGKGNIGVSASVSQGQGTTINTRSGAMTKSYFSSASVGVAFKDVSFGVGTTRSSSLPVGSISYSPRMSYDMIGSGFGSSVKAGLWGNISFYVNAIPVPPLTIDGGLLLGYKAFYNRMGMRDSVKMVPSYGYMYAENADDDALMDFNRFKDGPIMDETPNLSMANQTYDIFSATAQGMATSFRTCRSDNGTVHDNYVTTATDNKHNGKELGGIFIAHVQADDSKMYNTGYSGKWQTMLEPNFAYTTKDIKVATNRFYEKYYFKSMGEITARDPSYDGAVGGDGPIAPILNKVGLDYHAFSPLAAGTRQNRDARNNHIKSLTGEQASKYGYQPTYSLYAKIDASNSSSYPVVNGATKLINAASTNNSRTQKSYLSLTNKPIGHHLSEISVTGTNGSTYIYGIPVYNLHKKKVMFNASDRTEAAFLQNGWPTTNFTDAPLNKSQPYQLVGYDKTSGGKEINKNFRGRDNLYKEDLTPAFVNNLLLTTIVSEDYVDVEGDGPTYDDLGSFTKFNYFKNDNYGWREPYPLPVGAGNDGGSNWPSNGGNLTSTESQANYDPAMLSDNLDDRGFYEFGIRENYFLHSIETKDFIAIFETSNRLDQSGVVDEHGGQTNGRNQKLDAIKLFSKSDVLANGGFVSATKPLKTIRFEYDYSLCPGTFNSEFDGTYNQTRGKLTLKKVYFSYEDSQKSSLTPYVFDYGNNYNYNPRAVDRWGTYMPNVMNAISGQTTASNGAYMNNMEYPYALQDKSLADAYAGAWNLNEIQTPSGSIIKINYESDDYGYVQNEQAGQMVSLYNIVNDPVNPSVSVQGTYGTPNTNFKESNFFILDLQNMHRGIPVTGSFSIQSVATNFVKTNVFKTNSDLYFKVFTKLADPKKAFGLKKNHFEYIPGYALVEDAGVFDKNQSNNTYVDGTGVTCYRYAYVRVKKELAWDSEDVCPVTIAGWDLLRNYLPAIAYPGSEPASMGNTNHKPLDEFKNAKVGMGVAKADMMNAQSGKPNKRFYDKDFCTEFMPQKSFVRAYVPFKHKLGGGHRVKSITTSDRWDVMTGTAESKTSYGQAYNYSTKEGKYIISSGVAMYEPIYGGDEISLRKPIKFTIQKQMAPNDHLFQELPYGEMMYPAPIVGYSKVTVTTLADPENPSPPETCGIGKTEYEFFTAKEFPITFASTDVDKEVAQNEPIADYIVLNNLYKIFHAAQGHALKMNDMHGKLKAISAYGEDNLATPISGTRYFYKASGSVNGTKQLITTLPTINQFNQVQSVNMCKDIDITMDTGENISETNTAGTNFVFEMGLKLFFLTTPTFPFITPAIPAWLPGLPNINTNPVTGQQRFGMRQATLTKVVQQYGVIDRVEQFDNKSKTTTQNLLWDKLTGDVVLTKTTDNYDQNVFNFSYPAHWVYPRLGHKYSRDNIELLCPLSDANIIWNVATGKLKKSAITNPLLFDNGDEVRVLKASDGSQIGGRFWVQPDLYFFGTPEPWYLVDQHGVILNSINYPTLTGGDYVIKMIKPANQNNLYQSMGSVSSLNNPLSSGITFTTATKILNTSVQEFCSASGMFIDDNASSHKYTNTSPSYSTTMFNFVVTGFNSTLRPTTSYAYKSVRSYSLTQPQAKQDGIYSEFTPYWKFTSGKWAQSGATNWQKMNNNKYYSPYGQLVESENAILLPSCQKYSFNHTLPALSASNAKYEEVGFDSFEDYVNYGALNSIDATNLVNNDYMDFHDQMLNSTSPPTIVANTSHTGRSSLSFVNGNNVKLIYDAYRVNPFPYNGDAYSGCQTSVLNLSKLNLNGGTLGKKYILSMWVKGGGPTQAHDYSSNISLAGNLKHFLSVGGPNNVPITIGNPVNKSGNINGWQKLDFELTIPPASSAPAFWTNSKFELTISANSDFYLDDFRIQPFNSSMTCTVYDNIKYRVMAQLDDRNYATFIEYDNEGMVVRKKKETLNGILTVQETRKGVLK